MKGCITLGHLLPTKKSFLTCKNFYQSKKGIALTELIIYASLILIVFFLGYSIYLFGIQGYINNVSSIENQSNVRIAMEHITYHIRRSNSVYIKENSLIVGDESYSLSDNILMNKNNQLATGISEFFFDKPSPSLVYVKISSIPNKNKQKFSLEAYFHIMN